MSSSKPQLVTASLNPSDFVIATPAFGTPNLELGAPNILQGQKILSHSTANVSLVPSTSTPRNVHTPALAERSNPLVLPGVVDSISSNRDSYNPYSINDAQLLAEGKTITSDPEIKGRSLPKWRPLKLLFVALAALIVIILAVVIPVHFTTIKKGNSSASSASGGGSSSGGGGGGRGPGGSNSVTSGGDGSTVTTETGEQFTYRNPYGGFWISDPNDPFNNNAQANSWTPPLNTSWNWETDKIYGVNVGGLFVLEPFISPQLYQKYGADAVDEWTLSQLMAADTASGGLNQLENHYNTFITEQDIAEIAGAGLNWIRLPIPFWAIEVWDGEPFLAKVSWKYILRFFGWCRKYGIRVNLDLHSVPGSQNGYNHSGKYQVINFLNGVMGIANAQRTLGYMRIITEFISQPQYSSLVPMFGINEPSLTVIGQDVLESFYFETYKMMRGITGIGAGKGPYLLIHDANLMSSWAGFLSGADRIALDTHPYFAFNGGTNTDPISTTAGADAGGTWPVIACTAIGSMVKASQSAFGVTIGGEFSNAINDCGLFVKAAGLPVTYGGDCSYWEDATEWNATTKAGVQAWAMANMDALQNWFFWTWKVGNSTAGTVQAPLWSYQLGLRLGFMPTDPRIAAGKCASLGVTGTQFDGTYLPWQTGGVGAGTISPNASAALLAWPPISINGAAEATALPVYTATGTVTTLSPPTFTVSPTIDAGNGWFNAADTGEGITTIQGCTYPNPWAAQSLPIPAACAAATASYSAAAAFPIVTSA